MNIPHKLAPLLMSLAALLFYANLLADGIDGIATARIRPREQSTRAAR